MDSIVRSLTLRGRNFRWADYRIHKSACSGHSISWHCFLALTLCVQLFIGYCSGWEGLRGCSLLFCLRKAIMLAPYALRGVFFACCLYSTAMNQVSFFLCTIAAAVPYWPRWSLCKHQPVLSGRQWGKDMGGGGVHLKTFKDGFPDETERWHHGKVS